MKDFSDFFRISRSEVPGAGLPVGFRAASFLALPDNETDGVKHLRTKKRRGSVFPERIPGIGANEFISALRFYFTGCSEISSTMAKLPFLPEKKIISPTHSLGLIV